VVRLGERIQEASMETLAALLHHTGLLLYAGPLLAFAVMLSIGGGVAKLEPWQLDRAWRGWAPFSGLALGCLILGGLLRYYLLHDGFVWGLESARGQLFLAKHLVFLVLWIEYTYTEIWVAEPLRKLAPGPHAPADPAAYALARRRLLPHLWVGACCALIIMVISASPG
jgi:putative copper export protein